MMHDLAKVLLVKDNTTKKEVMLIFLAELI